MLFYIVSYQFEGKSFGFSVFKQNTTLDEDTMDTYEPVIINILLNIIIFSVILYLRCLSKLIGYLKVKPSLV